MPKLLRIEYCWQCKYKYLLKSQLVDMCGNFQTGKHKILHGLGIPSWCPLPNAEEQEKGEVCER